MFAVSFPATARTWGRCRCNGCVEKTIRVDEHRAADPRWFMERREGYATGPSSVNPQMGVAGADDAACREKAALRILL